MTTSYTCAFMEGYISGKRLFWVQDIARIIEKEGLDFLVATYQQAIESGVKRYILEGCHLSHVLFSSVLSDRIHTAIQQDKKIAQLSTMAIFAMNDVTDQSISTASAMARINRSVKNHFIITAQPTI